MGKYDGFFASPHAARYLQRWRLALPIYDLPNGNHNCKSSRLQSEQFGRFLCGAGRTGFFSSSACKNRFKNLSKAHVLSGRSKSA